MNKRKMRLTILFVGLVNIILVHVSTAGEFIGNATPKMSPPGLIKSLQKGGHIIYFRHAMTGKRGEKDVSSNKINDCSIQRNLSNEGITQSKAIGEAIKKLDIPIGRVYSSPYCRCKDTAKHMFGHYESHDALFFAIHVKKVERQINTEKLRDLLAAVPEKGRNTVLVSHTANLREAVSIWPKPEAVAHIFKPEGNEKFSYLGLIKPDEWIKLSN